jgi:putative transcriptional regulator
MIRFRLAEVMSDHAFKAGRRVEWKEVSEATGIHRSTLSKLLNTRGYNGTTDCIGKLCGYFNCRVEDLMVYVPDDEAGQPTATVAAEGPLSDA